MKLNVLEKLAIQQLEYIMENILSCPLEDCMTKVTRIFNILIVNPGLLRKIPDFRECVKQKIVDFYGEIDLLEDVKDTYSYVEFKKALSMIEYVISEESG